LASSERPKVIAELRDTRQHTPDALRELARLTLEVHLCVDMQKLFAEPTEWKTLWMDRIRPRVHRLVSASPERTIFTRFVPANRPGEGWEPGAATMSAGPP